MLIPQDGYVCGHKIISIFVLPVRAQNQLLLTKITIIYSTAFSTALGMKTLRPT